MTAPRFQQPRSAYVHVPFCGHRCGYCNFTLVAGRTDLIEAFLEALARELSWLAGPHPIDTLYVGGGTPTELSPRQLERLFELLQGCFTLGSQAEFSVEANPTDLSGEKTKLFRDSAVNRISLGVQSFDASKLAVLERNHRRSDIERANSEARSAVDAVSFDLIFAAPGESLAVWQMDLELAQRLQPDHVSTYGLTYERGARFWSLLQKQTLQQIDESVEQRMYEMAIDRLTELGYEQYEISSFAQPGRRCRHNEAYWTGRTYFGVGPGAARHVSGRRELNHRSTTTYLRRVLAGESPTAETESLSPRAAARERLLFGLRTMDGVDRTQFAAETGYLVESLIGDSLDELSAGGWIKNSDGRTRLTRTGMLLCDSICERLLDPRYVDDS